MPAKLTLVENTPEPLPKNGFLGWRAWSIWDVSPQTELGIIKGCIVAFITAIITALILAFVYPVILHAVTKSSQSAYASNSATISRVCGPHALAIYKAERNGYESPILLISEHHLNSILTSSACKK
jgi:hypothetical protein